MSKRFLLILLVLIVGFAGLLMLNKKDEGAEGGNTQAALTEHKEEGTSGVTLIEYGDFQCTACARYYPVIKQLRQEYKGRVTFQFRHLPLTSLHQNALVSSRAAEAAHKQGKFFEMHDLLYEGQSAWAESQNPNSIFEGYAQQLGMDVNKFREDAKSPAINDTVQADLSYAMKQGFQATPTFVLDGKKIDTPESLDAFKKLLDDQIAAKKKQ